MSRSTQRVQLARGYVLYQRPFRDSSLIVELFAREHGRLSVFARAARGLRSRFAALQPFQPLLLSWVGRGEAPQLAAAEQAAPVESLPPRQLLSAFYLNELLLKLLTRHDPHPQLFDAYESTLTQLRVADAERALRRFETQLLQFIGYGLNLLTEADTGQPVRDDRYYQFRPGVHGCVSTEAETRGAVAGHVLLRLAGDEPLPSETDLRQARGLMRAALDHCLEGRALYSRSVARSLSQYPRKETRA